MCTRPIEQDGNRFACRTCDECIATRKHDWVARAMMEKTLYNHTLCIAFTYNNETEHNRDAAKMFQYLDVRRFFARLREALKSEGLDTRVRFLCAGEQGDRNGRVHWHMIIYTNADLTKIGTLKAMRNGKRTVVTERAHMMTVGKKKIRLNWSLWDHGYVTFQEPDQGGMNYVLSYCLKDQFTSEKSKGTMREAKAETFATGLFRMSKRPAIGEQFLYSRLEHFLEQGAILPSLNLKVPGFHGYYHPSGSFRKKMLWGLVALNQRIVWATGANAPQWPALLAACADNETDMEVLANVKIEEEEETDFEFGQRLELNAGEQARKARIYQTRRTCGRALPCLRCLAGCSDEKIDNLGLYRFLGAGPQGDQWQYESKEGYPSFADRRTKATATINPDCQLAFTQRAKEAFPASYRKKPL